MTYDNDGNHQNNDGGGGVSALRKDIERWNVIEEEVSLTQRQPYLDDMTQQVESLLQFMDQYQTFSPLLKNRVNDDNDDKGNVESNFHKNDSNDEQNQVDSSFFHHSTVISSSSTSSSSSILSRHGLDVPNKPDDTHHHHHNTVMNASSPPPLDLVDDDPFASPVVTERDQLRRWVTQVRQAVNEWVQAHRHVMTQPPNDQIQMQQYEQTIVSLNDIIQEQRRRIHALERQIPNATHGTDRGATGGTAERPQTHHSPALAVAPPRIAGRDHLLSKPPRRSPETSTTTAMVLKTKNCKRIAHSNGTVQEIYYDDHHDPDHTRRGSSRKRLYEIIRFYNGDVKMTTGDHNNDNDEVETYYYYATSGVIQIARRPRRRDGPPSSPTTNPKIEYHYPNGQIEYHVGTERVVQFPNGRTTKLIMTVDQENVEQCRNGTR